MPAAGQVSWLSDHSTPHAFPARPEPSQWLHRGFRPRLQWRGRGGFAPPSLESAQRGPPGRREPVDA